MVRSILACMLMIVTRDQRELLTLPVRGTALLISFLPVPQNAPFAGFRVACEPVVGDNTA